MFWLYLTIFAYFLFALANIGDKLAVSKFKTEPIAYAFYVGILGISSIVLIPLGVNYLKGIFLILAFLAGSAFIFAAYFMYQALKQGEASRAITLLGSASPIFTFCLSFLFLKERLTLNQLSAFIFLVLALILISWQKEKKWKINKKFVFCALMAGLFFSFNYVLTKYLFNFDNYFTIFFWTRIGGVLAALSLLLFPKFNQLIRTDWQQPKKQKGPLLLAIQIAGGAGVMAQSYALKLASATLVIVLQVIQYALVFVFAIFLSKKLPVLAESLKRQYLTQKILALILVALGLYLITLK